MFLLLKERLHYISDNSNNISSRFCCYFCRRQFIVFVTIFVVHLMLLIIVFAFAQSYDNAVVIVVVFDFAVAILFGVLIEVPAAVDVFICVNPRLLLFIYAIVEAFVIHVLVVVVLVVAAVGWLREFLYVVVIVSYLSYSCCCSLVIYVIVVAFVIDVLV